MRHHSRLTNTTAVKKKKPISSSESVLYHSTVKKTQLDSDNNFRSDVRNLSNYSREESFSEPHSPGRFERFSEWQNCVPVSLKLALTVVSFILLKAKVGMLDNLLDIEVAYSLLKSGDEDLAKDPLDVNYEKLKTDLEVKKLFQISLIYF